MPYARPKPPAGGIKPNYPGVDSGVSTETEADHFGDCPVRGGPPPPHGRKYIKRGSRALGLLKAWRPLLLSLSRRIDNRFSQLIGSLGRLGVICAFVVENSTSPANKVTRSRQMIKTVNRSIPQVCNGKVNIPAQLLPTVSPLVVDQLRWLSASFTAHLSRATTDRWCRG
jgi:hypothetical protein